MIDDEDRSKYENQPVKADRSAVMYRSYGIADLATERREGGNKL